MFAVYFSSEQISELQALLGTDPVAGMPPTADEILDGLRRKDRPDELSLSAGEVRRNPLLADATARARKAEERKRKGQP
jgi:hypothetical protein